MALFSERYGYTKPREVIIREVMPVEIANGICTAFDLLKKNLASLENTYDLSTKYRDIEEVVWIHFFNRRLADFSGRYDVITNYLLSSSPWYYRLNLVEFSIQIMRDNFDYQDYQGLLDKFISYLNKTFLRLGYAYRIVNDLIVEITSEEEIIEIEKALTIGDSVATHLSTSLELLSKRPDGDYRNSIKESISAVEVICRELTGENTLGKALNLLKGKGIELPHNLETAFTQLYAYTNNKDTGIRHALMDETNEPGFDEARFLLVACSAFVNYLKALVSR